MNTNKTRATNSHSEAAEPPTDNGLTVGKTLYVRRTRRPTGDNADAKILEIAEQAATED